MSKFVRSIKNVASGYSSIQVIVRNATSNDPSGPTTYEMEQIASNTYLSQTDFLEIMDMLDRRLNDKGKNWRHVAKSLTVLDYLVRFGLDKCVLWSKDNLYIVKTLREFIHFDESNNDQGAIIRVKAKELVSLLRDDERLRNERSAASNGNSNSRNDRPVKQKRDRNQPYDEDLERALEISRITAEDEKRKAAEESDDPDLQAALKLSIEEDEMRKLPQQSQNQNLLDLNDEPAQPQFGFFEQQQYQQQLQQQQIQQQQLLQQQQQQQQLEQQQYQQQLLQQQQQQFFQLQQQQQPQQFDLFGNPIQTLNTGYYQPQQQQPQPSFTGFQPFQAQESIQPLKTGSKNPFALNDSPQVQQQQQPVQHFQPVQEQPAQQQPTQQQPQQLQQQQTASKYNDDTHSELNNLLAQATGLDTFGNTGATRIPHQHTKTQTFINSSGTGYNPQTNDVRVSSNATGNPFLQQQQVQPTAQYGGQPKINPAYTGYGFGNANAQQGGRADGPSLIDI